MTLLAHQAAVRMSRQEADSLAQSTQDAYSSDRFTSWSRCVDVLRTLGYDAREAEAILRSKHMRWAGDCATNPNHPNSHDVKRYMTSQQNAKHVLGAQLQQLVEETFV